MTDRAKSPAARRWNALRSEIAFQGFGWWLTLPPVEQEALALSLPLAFVGYRAGLITGVVGTNADLMAEAARALPYENDSLDALVLDPPYTPNHDNDLKRSVAKPYNLDSGPRSTPSIVALYAGGIAEAGRCLRRGGRLFVKCQDAVENHRRHWTHVNVLNIATSFGFDALDKFVLVQQTTPAMRQATQKRARSNHSYLWVFERKGFPW